MKSYNGLLKVAVTANSTNVVVLDFAPPIDTTLVFEVGTANIDYGSKMNVVNSVIDNGNGTWTVTFIGGSRGSFYDSVSAAQNGRLTKAHAVDSAVKAFVTTGTLHPCPKASLYASDQVVLHKADIKGAANAYTAVMLAS